ncbi:hypothetical protein B0O99DRAFT_511182 [Bisporella sp. PMI_857]|nr:hypothetical protein B0O99DRAFT_511182 [Bisporella sp. PMI_857]
MASNSTTASSSHIERTAHEPRDHGLHRVILSGINQVNGEVRLLRLSPVDRESVIKFQPGQWLDVHIPKLPKPGGFTITSPPSLASLLATPSPYLELAVQHTPNPPAAWLSRPVPEILNQELQIRVGGSFVWPPQFHGQVGGVKRIVFVAGGMGINPFMSMLSHLSEQEEVPFEITLLYSIRDPGPGRKIEELLFVERLGSILRKWEGEQMLRRFQLFLTSAGGDAETSILSAEGWSVQWKGWRMSEDDVLDALGPSGEREGTVVYVCGVPDMTDRMVEIVKAVEGIDERHVLCEKWW